MDQHGIYFMSPDGQVEDLSAAITDIFEDDIDWTKKQWFHASNDPRRGLCYFFVVYQTDSDTRPKRAIVLEAATGAFWVETFNDEIGDSCQAVISGESRLLGGGENSRLLIFNEGTADGAASTTGTATAGGSDTLDDTNRTVWVADALIGSNVTITSGTGVGQTRLIIDNTTTQIQVATNWATNPDTTSVYYTGTIAWSLKSKIFEFVETERINERAVEVLYTPTTSVT